MKPTGTLIAIGGNEKKDFKQDERFHEDFGEGLILGTIVQQAGGHKSRIEVITTASSIPVKVGENYEEAFDLLGAENVGILNIRSRKDIERPKVLSRIEQADAILFSGGNQSRLSQVFTDTEVFSVIARRYQTEALIVAGTSAGAMVMAEEMIAGGKHGNTFRKSGLKMGKGLGLLKGVIIDTHFIGRGRFGRLAEAVALFPDKLGIGLGEDTGIIIRQGNECEVIGSGMVLLFDGSDFSYNRSRSLKSSMPISLGNLIVHILAPHDKYSIRSKRIEVHHNPRYHSLENQ